MPMRGHSRGPNVYCDASGTAAIWRPLLPEGMQSLLPRWAREPGVEAALDVLDGLRTDRGFDIDAAGELPLDRLIERLDCAWAWTNATATTSGLNWCRNPPPSPSPGSTATGGPFWLTARAARAWAAMRRAADGDGVVLDAISGYRSHDYQLGIFERKLARGQDVRPDPHRQRRARLQRTPQRQRAGHRRAW